MNVDSKTVLCQASDEKVYNLLSDFNNLYPLVGGKVQNWSVNGNSCSFGVAGFMQMTISYIDKQPYRLLVVGPASNGGSPIPFRMSIHIEGDGANACRTHLAFELDGNPMMNMMLKHKLREAADKLVDQLAYYSAGL